MKSNKVSVGAILNQSQTKKHNSKDGKSDFHEKLFNTKSDFSKFPSDAKNKLAPNLPHVQTIHLNSKHVNENSELNDFSKNHDELSGSLPKKGKKQKASDNEGFIPNMPTMIERRDVLSHTFHATKHDEHIHKEIKQHHIAATDSLQTHKEITGSTATKQPYISDATTQSDYANIQQSLQSKNAILYAKPEAANNLEKSVSIPTPVTDTKWGGNVADIIKANIKDLHTLEVIIHPKHLGTIKISLDQSTESNVIQISTQSAYAASLVSDHVNSIYQKLNNAGENISKIDVQQSTQLESSLSDQQNDSNKRDNNDEYNRNTRFSEKGIVKSLSSNDILKEINGIIA